MLQHRIEFEHGRDFADALIDLTLADAPVAQGEGEIVVDRHGVVDDRKLEHLRDVARFRRRVGDVVAIEEDVAFGRCEQARDQVEERGLAAA